MNLAFDEFGQAHNPPLIILHGFFASSRNWRFVAENLATDFHVYVLDQRNHGASPHHPTMDYPALAEDLFDFLDQQKLTRAHILGHSMGGKVAMWFALGHPDRVGKLVVADIAPVSYTHNFSPFIHAMQALPLTEMTSRKDADNRLAGLIPDVSYRQFLLQNLVLADGAYAWRVDLSIFEVNAANIMIFPDTTNIAPYKGPALFLAGAQSNFVKPEALVPLFPDATLKVIEDAAHWLHVQQPQAFIDQTLAFLH